MSDAIQLSLTVPADHPAFPGHFPGRPILPGAALLDLVIVALQQALGLVPGAVTIASAKFLQPVGPGSRLALSAEIVAPGRWRCAVFAADGARVVLCELRFEALG